MRDILICGYRDWAFELDQKVNAREIDNYIHHHYQSIEVVLQCNIK